MAQVALRKSQVREIQWPSHKSNMLAEGNGLVQISRSYTDTLSRQALLLSISFLWMNVRGRIIRVPI